MTIEVKLTVDGKSQYVKTRKISGRSEIQDYQPPRTVSSSLLSSVSLLEPNTDSMVQFSSAPKLLILRTIRIHLSRL